jgi:hypothetical protein
MEGLPYESGKSAMAESEPVYIIPVSVVDAENVNDFQGFGNYEEKAE